MAINFGGTNWGLTRNGSYLSITSDFTILGWLTSTITGPGPGPNYKVYYTYGDALNGNPYIQILTATAGTDDICLEVFDGTHYFDSAAYTLNHDIWTKFAIRYIASTTSLEFWINNALIGTLIINLTTVSIVIPNEYAATDDNGSFSDIGLAFIGIWQRALSLSEMTAQGTSPIAISTTNLLSFTPLFSTTDFRDRSGNGHDWTLLGSCSLTTNPFTFNNTSADAIVLGSFPIDLSIDMSGVDPSLGNWYKTIEIPTYSFYLGMKQTINTTLGSLKIYESDGTTQSVGNLECDHADPIQQPVVPPRFYYFKIIAHGSPIIGNLVDFSIILSPTNTVSAGTLVINDDHFGFPAILYGPDGILKRIASLPAGEFGDVAFDDGTICFEAIDGSGNITTIQIYDKNFTLLSTTANPYSPNPISTSYDQSSRFFIPQLGVGGANRTVKTINKSGVIGGTTWTLTSNSLGIAVPNISGTLLYWLEASTNKPIKVWDLVGNVGLADLAPGIANYNANELFVMTDGSLLLSYVNAGVTKDAKVIHYSNTGTILNTYIVADGITIKYDHMCRALDDPNSFWLWLQSPGTGTELTSTFKNIKISDGSTIQSFTKTIFEGGFARQATTDYFGPGQSCFFFVTPFDTTGNLVIGKLTTPYDPSASFPIIAGGGLLPTTITLMDGQSQTYTNIPATNGYTVNETPPTDFTVEIFTSNGSPNTNIVVNPGEYVTVLVLNTLHALYSGLYALTPGRTNDNLLLPDGTRQATKFPDPYIVTALIPKG